MGDGEPLLLSQQLLLPLPVLLKLWLWTQGGGGSQSPAAPAPPTPPPKVNLVPQAPNEELDLTSRKCQQLWPLPQGCSQMLSPPQMCSARTRGRAGEGLSSGGVGIPCSLVQGPTPPQLRVNNTWGVWGGRSPTCSPLPHSRSENGHLRKDPFGCLCIN